MVQPCSRCPRRRRPITRPTRSPSRSATPTDAPLRPRRWRRADRARPRRGRGPPRRPRGRRLRRGGLPPRGLGRDARARSPAAGKPVTLHAHLILRDDALHLYGFAREEERDLFLMLIGVQGVGPKVALAVLSGGPPRDLMRAIAAGDAARFQAVPGIGKRTAERIIVELREKVGAAAARRRRSWSRRADDPRGWPATACSGLGYAPVEADELLDGAEGETPEELIAAALRGARRMSEVRDRASRRPRRLPEDELDRSLRPRRLEDFVGQEALKSQLAIAIEAAARARRGARPRAAGRPAGPGQDLAGADRRRRARRAVRADRRPGAGAQGRRRRVPHRARAAQRVLRRRDPPPPARAGGDLLPGDGGPPAADHGRPGRRRAGRHARPAAVHARRRHDARRPAHDAAARPLRHPAPPRPLRARRAGARSSAARPRSSTSTSTPPARAAIARRSRGTPARRQPPAQAGARLRRGARRRRRSPPTAADAAPGAARGRRRWAWTAWTARSSHAICEKFEGGPVGLSTLAVAVGEEADTIEDVYEPYLLQSGLLKRTPRGRATTARASPISGSTRPSSRQPLLSVAPDRAVCQPASVPCHRRRRVHRLSTCATTPAWIAGRWRSSPPTTCPPAGAGASAATRGSRRETCATPASCARCSRTVPSTTSTTWPPTRPRGSRTSSARFNYRTNLEASAQPAQPGGPARRASGSCSPPRSRSTAPGRCR